MTYNELTPLGLLLAVVIATAAIGGLVLLFTWTWTRWIDPQPIYHGYRVVDAGTGNVLAHFRATELKKAYLLRDALVRGEVAAYVIEAE